MNPIQHLSAPKCHCFEWLRTLHCWYKEGAGFGEWWEWDCAHNLYSKINYDFLNPYLYLYPAIRSILLSRIIAIRQILLSGIICIWLSGRFYYPCIPTRDIAVAFISEKIPHPREMQPAGRLYAGRLIYMLSKVTTGLNSLGWIPKAELHLHRSIIFGPTLKFLSNFGTLSAEKQGLLCQAHVLVYHSEHPHPPPEIFIWTCRYKCISLKHLIYLTAAG